MKQLTLTPAALADLEEVWHYTAERWSDEQAERYTGAIANACQDIADQRRTGRSIDDIRRGYFKLAIGKHLVIYRLTSDGAVDIVRILHQRMDVVDHLQ
jgi:toxin ParE1/3/4